MSAMIYSPGLRRMHASLKRLFSRKLFLHHTISALFLAGCLSPIDRFADYAGGQLVVSGQISTLQEYSIVYVGRTANSERLPEPVSGAHIVLYEDGIRASFFDEDQTRPGRYLLSGMQGTPGRVYHVQITLPDGKEFTSAPERMPLLAGDDEVFYRFEREEYTDGEGTVAERLFLNIYTNHTLPSSEAPLFLKWHVEEVYALSPTDFPDPFSNVPPTCYIDQQIDPQRIVLFSTEGTTATSIPELLVASRLVDPTFKERHYFTTFQSSLTPEAYAYWQQVNVVANQSGSIFDAPPARVKGNILNVNNPAQEVHGYFQATNQVMDRFYLLPDDVPFRMTLHCEYRSERNYYDYPSECLDCTSVRNSSYKRPSWF